MVHNNKIQEILYHLIRLSAQGKTEDFTVYLKRNIKLLQNDYPELVEKISDLAKQNNILFRNTKMANVPVDLDTRLELVRTTHNQIIEFEPIWDPSVQKALNQVVIERQEMAYLKEHGLLATKSIIFTGKPGVGKTLAAKWLAYRLKVPLLILDLSAVMSSFLGRTGSNLRNVLDYAKGMNCILLLDEIDAIAKKRDDSTDVGELKRLVTVILQEIENWPEDSLLIAATNHAKLLDPAVWRRFDLEIEFPMPNIMQVAQAIDLYMDKEKVKSSAIRNALTSVLLSRSYSDIERTIFSIRKNAVIKKTNIDEAIYEYVVQNSLKMDKEAKFELAKIMLKRGISKRSISELLGINRTTLSKKLKDLNNV